MRGVRVWWRRKPRPGVVGTALAEDSAWQLTFEEPHFLHGVGRKGGDLIMAAGLKGAGLHVFANNCRVKGREKQHDPMFFEWSCAGRRIERRIQPATGWVREIRPSFEDGGAPEHARNAAQRVRAHRERDDTAHGHEAEVSGAPERVERAAQHGRADDETEEPVHVREAEPKRCFRARCRCCPGSRRGAGDR